MNKRVAPRTVGLVASLVVSSLPFLAPSAQAETDYCAGHRLGYVFTRCQPKDQRCLRQKPKCNGYGTFKEGMAHGRALARHHHRIELQLVREIILRSQRNKQ